MRTGPYLTAGIIGQRDGSPDPADALAGGTEVGSRVRRPVQLQDVHSQAFGHGRSLGRGQASHDQDRVDLVAHRRCDPRRRLLGEATRPARAHDQADRVGARLDGDLRILHRRQTADLHVDHGRMLPRRHVARDRPMLR